MVDELVTTRPRTPLQVATAEGVDQQLRLVEPRRVGRCSAHAPPRAATFQVIRRRGRDVAGTSVVNQEHALQPTVAPAEQPQRLDVVGRVVGSQDAQLHPSGVHDQEQQQVDRAVSGVLEFLLLDVTRKRPTDRLAFQHLKVGHFIGTDDPDAPTGQALGIGVAPQHLLRSLLEALVQPRRAPVPRAVRLEVHALQDATNQGRADRLNDPVGDSSARQVRAGPVGDVQPLGERFQAGQLDDLGALEGGKSLGDVPSAGRRPGCSSHHLLGSVGRPARWWCDRTPGGERSGRCVLRRQRPRRSEHVGPGTKPSDGCER